MEKYEVLRLLGKGSFGSVYVSRLKSDSSLHVIKKISIQNMSTKERHAAEMEAKVLQRFHHPGIVPLEDTFIFKNRQLCIVMELCEGGDLAGQIEKRAGRRAYFKEEQILDWLLQICLALQYIHNQKILHRDLKTQNIFLTKDNQVKLGDFGIARVLEGTLEMAKTVIGTPYYMSPELFRNQPYSYKSDIWSLGCVLFELCSLRHAFEARDMDGLVQKILRANCAPLPSGFSRDMQALVKSLLQATPNTRPSIENILSLGFLRKRMSNYLQSQLGTVTVSDILGSSDEKGLAQQVLIKQAENMGVDVRASQEALVLQKEKEAERAQAARARIGNNNNNNNNNDRGGAGRGGVDNNRQRGDHAQPRVSAVMDPGRARRRDALERQRKAEEVLAREQRAKERAEIALRKLQEEKNWRAKESELRKERALRRKQLGIAAEGGHGGAGHLDWRHRLAKAQEEARQRQNHRTPSVFGGMAHDHQVNSPARQKGRGGRGNYFGDRGSPDRETPSGARGAPPHVPSSARSSAVPSRAGGAYGAGPGPTPPPYAPNRGVSNYHHQPQARELSRNERERIENARIRDKEIEEVRAFESRLNRHNRDEAGGYAAQANQARAYRGEVQYDQNGRAVRPGDANYVYPSNVNDNNGNARPPVPGGNAGGGGGVVLSNKQQQARQSELERLRERKKTEIARRNQGGGQGYLQQQPQRQQERDNGGGYAGGGRIQVQPQFIANQPDVHDHVDVVAEERGLVAARDDDWSRQQAMQRNNDAPIVDEVGDAAADDDIPFEEWLAHKRAAIEDAESELARRTLTVQMLQVTLGRNHDEDEED